MPWPHHDSEDSLQVSLHSGLDVKRKCLEPVDSPAKLSEASPVGTGTSQWRNRNCFIHCTIILDSLVSRMVYIYILIFNGNCFMVVFSTVHLFSLNGVFVQQKSNSVFCFINMER